MKAVGLSHIGYCRRTNEDCYFCDPEKGLFILCDGMGGHLGGEVASSLAVQIVKEEMQKNPEGVEPAVALGRAIEKANAAIWEKSQGDAALKEMGTTLTAALVVQSTLVVAHVGDSSLFVFDGEQSHKITHDHTLAESMRQADPSGEKAEFDSSYNNVLTRALGIEPGVRIDFYTRELSGWESILLTSDGLTDLLSSDEITGVLRNRKMPEEKTQLLVDMALNRGGYDNITVIFVQLEEGGRS